MRFPGLPSPPLGLLCALCRGIENWLSEDPANVAAVHCMTGKGRTLLVCACVLGWMGSADSPLAALGKVCEQRARADMDKLCSPSQTR